jgi:hypothetical protein
LRAAALLDLSGSDIPSVEHVHWAKALAGLGSTRARPHVREARRAVKGFSEKVPTSRSSRLDHRLD